MAGAGGMEEVVLSASSTEGAVQVWCGAACAAVRASPAAPDAARRRDLDTCTLLASYKGNASPRGCLCRMGATHFLAGASVRRRRHACGRSPALSSRRCSD
jgi:hypothetical protein